jgi:transcriptional regulator with XRE-family HTH domain
MKRNQFEEEEWYAKSTEVVSEEEVVGALGRRISALRREKGWTRVELAEKLGVSRERLGKWEVGGNSPPLGMLIRLRRVLAVTLDELVTGEPPASRAMTEEDRKALAACLERLARFLEAP